MGDPDWFESLQQDGYGIVPSVRSLEAAETYQTEAFLWLKSFDNDDLDLHNPSTWNSTNLPYISEINTFNHYGVVHEKFMWDIRLEPAIIEAFARIWGTDKLIVSFDALNITLPRRPGHTPRPRWPHVDQSPYREGLQCVQGIVNLSEAGPEDGGLVVFPGTHKVTERFFRERTDKASWSRRDFYKFSPDELAWFEAQGFAEKKVNARPGDLIVWDSRLIHYGSEPTPKSDTIRTVTYVSYAPAELATPEILQTKQQAFEGWLATTHWPHDNITLRSNEPTLPDGSVDRRRNRPRHEPEFTDRLLRLAGSIPY